MTATAVEYCLVTLVIRAAKQLLASLMLSILISPPLLIQMAVLLSVKRPKSKNLRLYEDQF